MESAPVQNSLLGNLSEFSQHEKQALLHQWRQQKKTRSNLLLSSSKFTFPAGPQMGTVTHRHTYLLRDRQKISPPVTHMKSQNPSWEAASQIGSPGQSTRDQGKELTGVKLANQARVATKPGVKLTGQRPGQPVTPRTTKSDAPINSPSPSYPHSSTLYAHHKLVRTDSKQSINSSQQSSPRWVPPPSLSVVGVRSAGQGSGGGAEKKGSSYVYSGFASRLISTRKGGSHDRV